MNTKELYSIIHNLQDLCDFMENKWRNIYTAIHHEYTFKEKRERVRKSGGDIKQSLKSKRLIEPFKEHIYVYFSNDLDLSLQMYQEYSERINELDKINYEKLAEEIYSNINSSKNEIDNLALYKEILEREISYKQIIEKNNVMLEWTQQFIETGILCQADIEYLREQSEKIFEKILFVKKQICSIIDEMQSKVNHKLDLLKEQESIVYVSNISNKYTHINNSRYDNSYFDNSVHNNTVNQDYSIHDNSIHNDIVKQDYLSNDNVACDNSDNGTHAHTNDEETPEVNAELLNIVIEDEKGLKRFRAPIFVLPEDYMQQKRVAEMENYYCNLHSSLKSKEKIELLYDLLSNNDFLNRKENVFRQFAFRLTGRGNLSEYPKIKWLAAKNDLFYLIKKIADQDTKKWVKAFAFFVDSDGEDIPIKSASTLCQQNNTKTIKLICDEIMKK